MDSQVIVDFQWAFLKNQEWKFDLGLANFLLHDRREIMLSYLDLMPCGQEGCCGNDAHVNDYSMETSVADEFRRESRVAWDLVDDPEELEDSDKILLSYRVFGYVLRNRKWAEFNIELLKDVRYNDGWSRLQLPDGHKDTVLALVQNHALNASKKLAESFLTMDLVRGKGKGLIILLHGEPGVGKTSTAECVADHTKRPLFPITCGDIGDTAEKVEENLENNFQLAHRWGCVLLLDEAE